MSRRALWLGVLMLFGVVHLIGMFYTGGHLRVVRFVKRSRQLNVVDFAKTQQLGATGTTTTAGAKASTQEVTTGPLTDPYGEPLPENLHANWKIQEPNQQLFKERLAPCPGSERATQLSKDGVGKVRSVVEADWRVEGREEETLKEAVELFKSAIKEDPNCRAAILNAAITLFGLAQNGEAKDLLRNWPGTSDDILDRKTSLYSIILQEQDNVAQSQILRQYRELAKRAPELAILYMGISAQDAAEGDQGLKPMFLLTSRTDAPGAQHILWAMRRLLMMQEFAEHMGGYPPLTKADADGWSQHWYISIPNMLPPYVLKTVQKFYRDMISNRILSREDQSGGGYQAVRYFSYNDAIARFMLGAYNQLIQRLADRPIKPTYTYFGGYVNAAVLTPHRDRQQCEYTMSVNLDINPMHAQCPLGFGIRSKKISAQDTGGSEPLPPPAERRYVYHRPGDGVLIRGRIITHWRDQMPPNFNCTQLFLHYVHGEFKLTLR